MTEYLTYENFIDVIRSLSGSQGSYGRLLRQIEELDEDKIEQLREVVEAQKFRDAVDVVMWIEG